jgi:hypothetical protein
MNGKPDRATGSSGGHSESVFGQASNSFVQLSPLWLMSDKTTAHTLTSNSLDQYVQQLMRLARARLLEIDASLSFRRTKQPAQIFAPANIRPRGIFGLLRGLRN